MNTINYFPYDNKMNLEDALQAASAGEWQFKEFYRKQLESFKYKFLVFYAKNYEEFLDDISKYSPKIDGRFRSLKRYFLSLQDKKSNDTNDEDFAKFLTIYYNEIEADFNKTYSTVLKNYWKIKFDSAWNHDVRELLELRNAVMAFAKLEHIGSNLKSAIYVAGAEYKSFQSK